MKLSKRQAREKLEAAILAAGSAKAYAQRLQMSEAVISDMRRGNRYISGRVADDLGLRRIVSQTVAYLSEELPT